MVFWDTYGPFFKNGRKGALFQFCSALFAKIGVFVIELGAFRAANLNRGLAERVDAFGRTGRGGTIEWALMAVDALKNSGQEPEANETANKENGKAR